MFGFTLGENLLGEIQDFGRTSTLENVRKQTKGQEEAAEQQATLINGLALRNAGDVALNEGNLEESLKKFAKALKTIESSPNPDKPQQKARETAARTIEWANPWSLRVRLEKRPPITKPR